MVRWTTYSSFPTPMPPASRYSCRRQVHHHMVWDFASINFHQCCMPERKVCTDLIGLSRAISYLSLLISLTIASASFIFASSTSLGLTPCLMSREKSWHRWLISSITFVMIIGHLLSTVSYLTVYVGQFYERDNFITYENLAIWGQWIEHN